MLSLDADRANTIIESRIVLTAVAPTPVIAQEAGAYLAGKPPSSGVFAEAATLAGRDASPITDIRGTAEFRAHIVEVLSRRALEEALKRARPEGI
jgi:carbon-monoxide dehydrogenase medium subunit